ncbi:MAG: hypothetical protein ACFFF4_06900 [Candidatus Thorarchaeota archaeon]
MRRKSVAVRMEIVVVIFNLMMLVISPIPVLAGTVWSDNFDDGNFDGWTTSEPDSFSASNGYLESIDDTTPLSSRPGIHYESNVTRGTWSFDFYVLGEYNDSVYFTGMRIVFWSDESVSYNIDFEPWLITFYRFVQWPGEIRGTWTSPVDLRGTWHHMDITISEPFVFDIFIDEVHRIHNEYGLLVTTLSEGFTVIFGTIGEGIDNVVVSDTVDFQPNETTTTTTTTTTTATTDTTTDNTTDGIIPIELLAVGIAIPVVIVIAIVGIRMRRS